MASNDTELSFPVTEPMQVQAQWTPNWTYLLMLVGAAVGVTVPSTIFAKRKLGQLIAARRAAPKKTPKKQGKGSVAKAKGDSEGDLKLYNYIIDHGGSISIQGAMKELGLSREEVTEAIERLKESHMLG